MNRRMGTREDLLKGKWMENPVYGVCARLLVIDRGRAYTLMTD